MRFEIHLNEHGVFVRRPEEPDSDIPIGYRFGVFFAVCDFLEEKSTERPRPDANDVSFRDRMVELLWETIRPRKNSIKTHSKGLAIWLGCKNVTECIKPEKNGNSTLIKWVSNVPPEVKFFCQGELFDLEERQLSELARELGQILVSNDGFEWGKFFPIATETLKTLVATWKNNDESFPPDWMYFSNPHDELFRVRLRKELSEEILATLKYQKNEFNVAKIEKPIANVVLGLDGSGRIRLASFLLKDLYQNIGKVFSKSCEYRFRTVFHFEFYDRRPNHSRTTTDADGGWSFFEERLRKFLDPRRAHCLPVELARIAVEEKCLLVLSKFEKMLVAPSSNEKENLLRRIESRDMEEFLVELLSQSKIIEFPPIIFTTHVPYIPGELGDDMLKKKGKRWSCSVLDKDDAVLLWKDISGQEEVSDRDFESLTEILELVRGHEKSLKYLLKELKSESCRAGQQSLAEWRHNYAKLLSNQSTEGKLELLWEIEDQIEKLHLPRLKNADQQTYCHLEVMSALKDNVDLDDLKKFVEKVLSTRWDDVNSTYGILQAHSLMEVRSDPDFQPTITPLVAKVVWNSLDADYKEELQRQRAAYFSECIGQLNDRKANRSIPVRDFYCAREAFYAHMALGQLKDAWRICRDLLVPATQFSRTQPAGVWLYLKCFLEDDPLKLTGIANVQFGPLEKSEFRVEVAKGKFANGELKLAKEILKLALERDSPSTLTDIQAEGFRYLADICWEQNDFEESQKWLDKISEKLGNCESAIQKKQMPTMHLYKALLMWLSRGKSVDLDEIVQLIVPKDKTDPTRMVHLRSHMAEIYLSLGKNHEAAYELEKIQGSISESEMGNSYRIPRIRTQALALLLRTRTTKEGTKSSDREFKKIHEDLSQLRTHVRDTYLHQELLLEAIILENLLRWGTKNALNLIKRRGSVLLKSDRVEQFVLRHEQIRRFYDAADDDSRNKIDWTRFELPNIAADFKK